MSVCCVFITYLIVLFELLKKKNQCIFKENIPIPFNWAILHAGIYLEDTPPLIWKCTCARVFMAVLFVTAKYWKLPKCPSLKTGWINYGARRGSCRREWGRLLWTAAEWVPETALSGESRAPKNTDPAGKTEGTIRKHTYVCFFLHNETQEGSPRKQSVGYLQEGGRACPWTNPFMEFWAC